jgi:hypothetical protein
MGSYAFGCDSDDANAESRTLRLHGLEFSGVPLKIGTPLMNG